VILLGGWLLIVPPSSSEPPNISAPATQWKRYGAYDTAEDCQSGRVYAEAHAKPKLARALLESRSIAAEAIHPPKEPVRK
jgi:hypothetical protein